MDSSVDFRVERLWIIGVIAWLWYVCYWVCTLLWEATLVSIWWNPSRAFLYCQQVLLRRADQLCSYLWQYLWRLGRRVIRTFAEFPTRRIVNCPRKGLRWRWQRCFPRLLMPYGQSVCHGGMEANFERQSGWKIQFTMTCSPLGYGCCRLCQPCFWFCFRLFGGLQNVCTLWPAAIQYDVAWNGYLNVLRFISSFNKTSCCGK